MDANNKIAITGTTYSYNLPLLNAHQSSHGGSLDAYVTVIDADGQSLAYSSYLGGGGIDHGRGVDFDSEGNLYVTGQIGSEGLGTENAFQNEYAGGALDGYLAKFTTDGSMECFSYLGGSGMDRGNDLRVDSKDKIVITGYTLSDDFPTHKPYQEELTKGDAFITKFDSSGQEVDFSTFIGGSSYDYGNALALDTEDNIIITGHTTSNDYPTTKTIYPLLTEIKYNVHLTKMSKDGSTLLFSTSFGGEQEEYSVGVASDENQSIIMIGFTHSENYSTYHAIQGKYGGNCDMFILKIQKDDMPTKNRKSLIISLSVVGSSTVIIATAVLVVLKKRK